MPPISDSNGLNWNALVFGSYTRDEIREAITDEAWQVTRTLLLGTPLDMRHARLCRYRSEADGPEELRRREVRITNYVNALKRAGLVG